MTPTTLNESLGILAAWLGPSFHQDWTVESRDWVRVLKNLCEDGSRTELLEVRSRILTVLRLCGDQQLLDREFDLRNVALPLQEFGETPLSFLCRAACTVTEWLTRTEGHEEWEIVGKW